MRKANQPSPQDFQLPLATLLVFTAYCAILATYTGLIWSLRTEPKLRALHGFGDLTFGIAFCAMGLLCLLLTSHQVGWWWCSRRWKIVDGTILSSKVIHDSDSSGPNLPEIKYEFEIAGKKYTSQYVRFGGYENGDAELLVAFCTPGRLVRVYYDPVNPQRCCLQRLIGGWIAFHLTGFFFALLGILFCVFHWK